MRSERLSAGLVLVFCALLAGCPGPDDPCIRHSDCPSGKMCVMSRCQTPDMDQGDMAAPVDLAADLAALGDGGD